MLCKPQDSHNPWIKLWGRVICTFCQCNDVVARVRLWIHAVHRISALYLLPIRGFLAGLRTAQVLTVN